MKERVHARAYSFPDNPVYHHTTAATTSTTTATATVTVTTTIITNSQRGWGE